MSNLFLNFVNSGVEWLDVWSSLASEDSMVPLVLGFPLLSEAVVLGFLRLQLGALQVGLAPPSSLGSVPLSLGLLPHFVVETVVVLKPAVVTD